MIKNVKLFISVLFIAVFSSAVLMANDMPIQANQLPKQAQDFINANFANDPVVYAEQDRNSFKAELQSGVEIDFDKSGNWTDVTSERTPLPTNFMPTAIVKSVQAKYPQVPILEISKEYSGYKLKLGNNREVYLDNNGKITGDKLD